MLKTIRLAAAAAVIIAALPLSAEAFPVATAPVAGPDAGVTLVAGGCGPGFHRGPLLGCRPNGFRRPFVRPLVRPFVRRPFCRTVLLPLPHRVCR
ncbi:GCG_CRPN prefix-to-repeats domain-containing protein [Lichenibacterium ramalinae]|uniref:Porin n=1 Tax=Lichenibacterium ramalinae TaxID=2316527 RepID=A0A4Q2RBV5_9HYPH|nr:hypothetical protein [Lichenibacterium ramalinae]RYB02444.1 hypothetical protein D3272_21195 [Lichenibacterium ramalinae]